MIKSRSLGTKFIATSVGAALLASVAFAVVWYRTAVDGQLRSINGSLASSAARAATAVQAQVGASLDAIRVQARLQDIVRAAESRSAADLVHAQRELTTLNAVDPLHLLALALMDLEGNILASTDGGRAFSDSMSRADALTAVTSNVPIATPIRMTPEGGRFGRYRVAAVVRNPTGTPIGVLAAEYTSSAFEEILREQARLVHPEAEAILYDRFFVRLAGTIPDDELFRTSNPLPDSLRTRFEASRRLRLGGPASASRRDVRNLEIQPDSVVTYRLDYRVSEDKWVVRLGAAAPVRPFSGRVSIEVPERTTLGITRRRLVRNALGLMLVVTLVVGVIAVMIGRRLTLPLLELTDTVRRFSEGQREARVPVRAADETGQLAKAFNELADRIENLVTGLNERTRQLEDDITKREALEAELVTTRKLEAVGKLAGGVAHDFNNLLSVVLQNVDFVRSEPSLPAESHDALNDVQDAAHRGAELTRQLLTFAKRGAGEPRVVDVVAAIRATERLMSQLLGSHVVVRLDLPADACCIRIDPSQLEQVLLNLAVNSRDAMPRGGSFLVTVRRSAPSVERPQGSIELTIADTGVGMSPETAARAFEPFFSTKSAGKGTGLGLATVYGIVTQAGGTIAVESTEGVGTTFRIALPFVDEPPDRDVMPAAANTGPSRRACILIVEDEMTLRHTLARALRRAGHVVYEAADGEEGIALGRLHGSVLDLLVTDVVMAGADGFTVATTLSAEFPQLSVLLMSGYSTEARETFARDTVAFPILEKPFSLQAFTEKINDVLASQTRRPAR